MIEREDIPFNATNNHERRQTSARGWHLPLAFSAASSIWMVSTNTLGWLVLDMAGEPVYWAFEYLVLPLFFLSLICSFVHVFIARHLGMRVAISPIAVNVVAAALVFWPLSPLLDRIEFSVHYAARMEVVSRLESGELWDGSPLVSAVSLPSGQYPRSVAGSRDLVVFREGEALCVVFPTARNVLTGWSAFLYRTDTRPPSLPNTYLRHTTVGESLGNGWYRLVSAE